MWRTVKSGTRIILVFKRYLSPDGVPVEDKGQGVYLQENNVDKSSMKGKRHNEKPSGHDQQSGGGCHPLSWEPSALHDL